jgi:hypothetical protein
MKDKDPSIYIREMIEQFQMPGKDWMNACLYSPGKSLLYDSEVFISTRQSENFYKDIFQFWVRALFCFSEDMSDRLLFMPIAPLVACRQITPKEFQESLHGLIDHHIEDQTRREAGYPEFHIEIKKRSFSRSYSVLNHPDLESSVAESEGEFIAYFHRTKNCSLPAQP